MHVYTVSNDAKHRRKIQKENDCNEVTGLLFLSHFSSIIVFLSVNCLPWLRASLLLGLILKSLAYFIISVVLRYKAKRQSIRSRLLLGLILKSLN